MSKFRLIIALSLCSVLAITATAGCRNKTAGGGADGGYPGSAVEVNGDKIYPVSCSDKLTLWSPSNSTWITSYENFGDTPLGMKIKKNTGINIEFIHPEPGQEEQQFNLLLAAGELPDLVEKNWTVIQGGPDKAIEDGYIYSLNDIAEKWSPAFLKIMNENEEWARDAKSDNGNFYAYPLIRGGDILTVGTGLMLRGDWLDELGMETPETIDEWEAVLTAFKEKKGASAPLSTFGSLLKYFMTAFDSWSGMYLDDGKVVYGEYTDNFKEYLTVMADWYKKGLIDPDIAVLEGAALDKGMLNGDVGATAGWIGSAMGKWISAAKANGNNSYRLTAAQFPVREKGASPEYGYKNFQVYFNYSVAITKNCSNVELAARYLDYGYTEEGHILYNFGIEGESFNWVDKDGEKYPQYTDLILKNPEGLSVSSAMGPYTRSCYNGQMVQDKRYLEQYYTEQDQLDALDIWSKVNQGKHLIPNVTILAEESDRYSEINANIQTYMDEMYLKFLTGEEPIENFDKYIEQLKAFGIDELIAMKQSAYDRWNKR